MGLKYKYTGDGAYLPGIPTRDLTDEDWEELLPEQRAAVKANAKLDVAIYEEAKPAKRGD